MVFEWIQSLFERCPKHLRDMGYLHETIAIRARYNRCRKSWNDHLMNTRNMIFELAEKSPDKRKILIIGTGHILDIPYRRLAAMFEEVIFLDIFHPRHAENKVAKYPNIKLVSDDITSVVTSIYSNPKVLVEPDPRRFLADDEIDIVFSVNCLSQLPLVPKEWLLKNKVKKQAAEEYAYKIAKAHIEYLKKFKCPCYLITDIETWTYDNQAKLLSTESVIYDLEPPNLLREWMWGFAPAKELDPKKYFVKRVGAFKL